MSPFLSSISWRINNDLLMWESPPPANHSPEHSRHHQDEFQLCKSAFRLGELLHRFAATLHNYILIVESFLREAWPFHQTQIRRRMSLSSTWLVNRLEGSGSWPPVPNTTLVCCPSLWWSAKDVSKPEQTRRWAVRLPGVRQGFRIYSSASENCFQPLSL